MRIPLLSNVLICPIMDDPISVFSNKKSLLVPIHEYILHFLEYLYFTWRGFFCVKCEIKLYILFHLKKVQLGISRKMPLAKDLLHPSPDEERRKCKLKRLVQHPNSFFMDVKCPGCYKITTVFSHAQTVVLCVGCSTVLCQPTGGRARLTEGCSFRKKQQ
ncbi:40S ribosomal protein S27 [Nephila pilipes]|uniref:40S ribosomal protein S27 n=2 Tax=Araneoidea TaxID=74975 RepID=A0A8X6P3P1_NEPPI|nr:40S ribosomal protein S27 [Nephila pilipes]